jgi:type I restriction enzyme, S subunit
VISDLKPYAEYKESGLPWLGQVPGHWEVVPSKSLFRHRKEKARPDDQMLTASQAHGIIARDEFMAIEGRRVMHVFTGADILKHVEPNDFVMSMRSFQGGLEWSKVRGAISSAYVMLIPTGHVHPPYYARLLKSPPYIVALRRTSDLVRDGQALRYANFGQVPLPRVPRIEQTAIVRFLDWARGRLDRAIRAKRKVIALLGEQKQAIIHRAVTRGLDPSVPLKPSGIPWLGDIPQHWEVRRAKCILKEIDLRSATGAESLLRVSQYTGVTPRMSADTTGMPRAETLVGYKLVREGDLVINIMIAWNGSLGASKYAGLVSPAYCVYRFAVDQNAWYFHYLLRTKLYGARIKQASTGVIESRLRLYSDALGRIELLIPPSDEQHRISDRIETETAGLTQAISRLEREIELLREYRARLVADVVTGKLDVREAAARLPDDSPLDTVEDEADLGEETAADEEIAA